MSFDLKVLAFLLGLTICSSVQGSRILVDDFSIPQGPVTSRIDQLDNPMLTFGGREISASTDAPPSQVTSEIRDGEFVSNLGGLGIGDSVVLWPRIVNPGDEPMLDLTPFSRLEFDVNSIVGEVGIRISIAYDNGIRISGSSTNLTIENPGTYSVDIEDSVDKDRVYFLAISSAVDAGESIALDSVWLVVPEPSSGGCMMMCTLWLLLVKRANFLRRSSRL